MEKYKISSDFKSLPIEIFWYPAKRKTSHTVILLKGLYGSHDPKSQDSWDNEIIEESQGKYNFVCINTARKKVDIDEKRSQKAFTQKTFKQECNDVYKAYLYLIDKKILLKSQKFLIVGSSFGGTTLLGIPDLIDRSSSIIMIGSGCGKSAKTTKPLLKTLFNEKKLLKPISSYQGVFVFVRGSDDKIVPQESQNKIIEAVSKASIKITYIIQNAQHNLSSSFDSSTKDRRKILSSILENSISLIE